MASCETVQSAPPQLAASELIAADMDAGPGLIAAEVGPAPLPEGPSAPVGPTARMPMEVRIGTATMVIQEVERDVSRDEVTAAVQALIGDAPVCLSWPALWIQSIERRSLVLVRFDLMARDWGEEAAAGAEARMQDFVDLGYMTKRERTDLAVRAMEFSLTPEGRRHLQGLVGSGGRPTFCGPAQRRLVEITSMEWGRFPCGTLHVRFSHVADDWPSWAQTEGVRARLAATLPAAGQAANGEVSLSRQWYRPFDLPEGVQNGALRSICYNEERNRVTGNDLVLFADQ
jgi:hypothetical protein